MNLPPAVAPPANEKLREEIEKTCEAILNSGSKAEDTFRNQVMQMWAYERRSSPELSNRLLTLDLVVITFVFILLAYAIVYLKRKKRKWWGLSCSITCRFKVSLASSLKCLGAEPTLSDEQKSKVDSLLDTLRGFSLYCDTMVRIGKVHYWHTRIP